MLSALPDEALNRVAAFLGVPDTDETENYNRQSFKCLWSISYLAFRFAAWFAYWKDNVMDLMFHA